MQALKVVAAASSEETRSALYAQLRALPFVEFNGVLLELSDAAAICQQDAPDVLIVDLTGRELDAELFMKSISMDPDQPTTIFALHRSLDHAIIVQAVQHGAREFIQYPDEAEKLDIALKKYFAVISRKFSQSEAKAREPGRLISVFSAKGGVGASTVAVNLAAELRSVSDRPVALLDLDQVFSNMAVMLNLTPSHSLGDLADSNPADLDDAIFARVVVSHESGIDIAVGSKSVLDDHELISPELLTRTVDYFLSHYAFLVVDLPSHVLDPYHQFMVERSDMLLLVSALDVPGLARTRQYLELARQYLELDKIKLALNRWNQKAAYGMSNESVEEKFGYPVFARLPNDWELNVEATSLGCVYAKIRPQAELTRAYRQMAMTISGLSEAPAIDSPAPGKGGFLSKLFVGKKK